MIDSTSWRVEGPAIYVTYIVAVQPRGLVLDRWPDALPIGLPLADAVGKPFSHKATEPPTPRYVDVLMHALRHVRFLLDSDATSTGALSEEWKQHLDQLAPALSTMYDRHHGLSA